MNQNLQDILSLVAAILMLMALFTFGFFLFRDFAQWWKRYKQITSSQNQSEEKIILKPHFICEIIACVFYVFFQVIAKCLSVPLDKNASWMTAFVSWPQHIVQVSVRALPLELAPVLLATSANKFNRMPVNSSKEYKKED